MCTLQQMVQAVFAVLLLYVIGRLYPDILKDEYANS